ncbi:hypothetical protein [Halalkalibacter alkalisediminis]|uniref:Uncharacterized protein n=1 Tax=Halalkalibacter alkalisediminis TaxID=935616 RepID=A0ABV6NG98_9BACI|nr:hypothetical protein [Halalkalibacter alkalisediminis]
MITDERYDQYIEMFDKMIAKNHEHIAVLHEMNANLDKMLERLK